MSAGEQRRDKSRRKELQDALEAKGIEGYILPRHGRGTLERPAQGWYVKLEDGRTEFLGDNTLLAVQRMELVTAPAPAKRAPRKRKAA